MQACEQTQGQSVLAHGQAVHEAYLECWHAGQSGSFPRGWRQPKWWNAQSAHRLVELQPSLEIMEDYHVFHDCGKPYCRTVDDQGRVHFPDHARLSAQIWQQLGGSSEQAWLMSQDMLFHTGTAQDIDAIGTHPLAPALLMTALAELHANAPLFGGIHTDSFKAKAKRLERRGAQLMRLLELR